MHKKQLVEFLDGNCLTDNFAFESKRINAMQAKPIITAILMALSIFSQTIMAADKVPARKDVVIGPKEIVRNRRPKIPSQQQILCTYVNEHLNFQFAIPEGECQLTVTDVTTGFARQYVFDSSADATINVGALTQAHIEISTANGHEYEGWLGME